MSEIRIYPSSTNWTADTIVFDHIPSSPLRRLQCKLQAGRFYLLGNLVSDLRYWLWRLSR